jgi:hypothetical protein
MNGKSYASAARNAKEPNTPATHAVWYYYQLNHADQH